MKKCMLTAVCVIILLILCVPLFTYCGTENGEIAAEAVVSNTDKNGKMYRLGMAAYSAVTDATAAECARVAVTQELCDMGFSADSIYCEYMMLRDTGELDEVLETMCRGCDAVFTLDSVSTAHCAAVYDKYTEESLAPLFFCCADAESAEAAKKSGMAAGSVCGDAAPGLADIAAEMTRDMSLKKAGESAKPGVIYNSSDAEYSEAVCSRFDAAGADYTVCAPENGDMAKAFGELKAAGADYIVVTYPMLPRYDAVSLPTTDMPVFCMEPCFKGNTDSADGKAYIGFSVSLAPDIETGARGAARFAAEYFGGKPISEIDSRDCPYLLTVSRREAEKFGLAVPESGDGILVAVID